MARFASIGPVVSLVSAMRSRIAIIRDEILTIRVGDDLAPSSLSLGCGMVPLKWAVPTIAILNASKTKRQSQFDYTREYARIPRILDENYFPISC